LSQVQNEVERPIAFFGRQINKAESNYSALEAEILLVFWATRQFRCHFYGKRFLSRTDHSALTYLRIFAGNNSRILRWNLRLAEIDFEIEHRAGTKIRHVDALSRHVNEVSTDQTLSKELIRAVQEADQFWNTVQLGKREGKSECFRDEERVIYRRRKNGEHQLVVPIKLIRDILSQGSKEM
jgi:hypothetical protein